MTLKSQRVSSKEARRWMGQPVCIVLKDGNYYVGYITEVENGEITLSGQKGLGKMNRSSIRHAAKARVSGLFPEMTSPVLGGGWGADPFAFNQGIGGQGRAGGGIPSGSKAALGETGFVGFMSKLGKVWPSIKMGIGMLQTIMPLLGGLKI
ncbi:hypothetical protein [Cohnella sp.]|uniref:hypothetical protein n=1 Tax=Cohnella sp. TaxID=1883426 RepID=UPI00356B1D4B